jgi:GAF domain-containing protein
VPRVYLATVRGELSNATARRLQEGIEDSGEILSARQVRVRNRSRRDAGTLLQDGFTITSEEHMRRGLSDEILHDGIDDTALTERERLALLSSDVSTTLVHSHSLQETLDRCCEAIVRDLGVPLSRIWTADGVSDVLTLQASAGLTVQTDGTIPAKVKVDLIGSERKPVLTNEALGDPEISNQEWVRREGIIAFAGYPLIVEDQLLGVISVFSRQPLSKSTLQALAVVADGIALGIERLRAEAKAREETEVVETINRIGQMLSAELDQQKLVQAVTDAATELTGAQFGSFFYNVINDEGASYMLFTLSGAPREAFAQFPMPRATELFGRRFAARRASASTTSRRTRGTGRASRITACRPGICR